MSLTCLTLIKPRPITVEMIPPWQEHNHMLRSAISKFGEGRWAAGMISIPISWKYHVFSLNDRFIGIVFKIKSQVSALRGALYHRNDSHGRFSKILCQDSSWSDAHVSNDNTLWHTRFQRNHTTDLRSTSGNATCHYAMPARFQDGNFGVLTNPHSHISPVMSLIIHQLKE